MNVYLKVGDECEVVHIVDVDELQLLYLRFERDVNEGYNENGSNQVCSNNLAEIQFELI
jgi:hypothetical protein